MRFERGDGYRRWVGGPVPPGADAITLGRLIIVRRRAAADPYVLRHELVHVHQYAEYGAVAFLGQYLWAYVKGRLRRKGHAGAYRRIPLEIEADWIARRALTQRADARAGLMRP
jgi:hypothetical protein